MTLPYWLRTRLAAAQSNLPVESSDRLVDGASGSKGLVGRIYEVLY